MADPISQALLNIGQRAGLSMADLVEFQRQGLTPGQVAAKFGQPAGAPPLSQALSYQTGNSPTGNSLAGRYNPGNGNSEVQINGNWTPLNDQNTNSRLPGNMAWARPTLNDLAMFQNFQNMGGGQTPAAAGPAPAVAGQTPPPSYLQSANATPGLTRWI